MPGHFYLFHKGEERLIFSPQDRLYFHHALCPFIYFTHFPHKNIYIRKTPARPPRQYSNGGPLMRTGLPYIVETLALRDFDVPSLFQLLISRLQSRKSSHTFNAVGRMVNSPLKHTHMDPRHNSSRPARKSGDLVSNIFKADQCDPTSSYRPSFISETQCNWHTWHAAWTGRGRRVTGQVLPV